MKTLLKLVLVLAGVSLVLPSVAMPPPQDQAPEQMAIQAPFVPDGPRLALVISQGDYAHGLSRIAQAASEANMIAAALEATGFSIDRRHNLDRAGLAQALDEFRVEVERAGPDTVAFVYYTGHGAQHPETGDSYLLGTDAKLRVASDLAVYGIDMASQRDGFSATRARAVFMVFDACRNTGGLEGYKTATKGLSRVEARADMLIAYATGLGDVAREGVYAPILAEELVQPGQTAEAAFTNAQRRVAQTTGREQLPWTNNLLYNTVCFAGCEAGAAPIAVTPRTAETGPGASAPAADTVARQAAADGMAVSDRMFRDCETCPDMVAVPAGSFTMGARRDEEGSGLGEQPQRMVSVPAFAIGATEVTWQQWNACVTGGGCNPMPVTEAGGDEGFGLADRPVINVSWDDAVAYAAWLSEETGQAYRLVSEAEWEYAARAGSTANYHFGFAPDMLCDYANVLDRDYTDGRVSLRNFADCSDGAGRETVPVMAYKANDFGVFDVHGNVAEWTADCFAPSYRAGQPVDGSAFETTNCRSRVLRGGSWNEGYGDARSAARGGRVSDYRDDWIGFRVARDWR